MSTETQNPATRTRAEINRENAKKSTGPRTPEGKAKASLNAFRHGITGQVMCLTQEDRIAYCAFTNRMVKEFATATMHEEQLAQRIADCAWRMNRMRAMETHILTLAFNSREDKMIVDHPELHGALATADGLCKKLPDLATLSIHEQRISRQYDKALKTLEETQSKRRIQEERALEEAANLYDLHKEDNPASDAAPYNPKEDGFVFSVAQIDTYLSRQIRVHRSLKCQDRRYTTART